MKKILFCVGLLVGGFSLFGSEKQVESKRTSETTSNVDVTKFFDYVRENNAQAVAACLAINPDLIKTTNDHAVTPLYLAAENGCDAVVKTLIDAGVVILEGKNIAAIYVAAQNGHDVVVTMFVNAGVDVNQDIHFGCTPLWFAVQNGRDAVVKVLIGLGADVNKASAHDGSTPLYVAAEKGYDAIAKTLIAAGPDVNKTRFDGSTPLLMAADRSRNAIVKMLIDAGAKVNQVGCGLTALLVAAGFGNDVIVKLLIAAGAEVNQGRTSDGATPVYVAAENGHDEVVKTLLAAGANINQCRTSLDGLTPLAIACDRNRTSVIRTLLGMSLIDTKWDDKPWREAVEIDMNSESKLLLENARSGNHKRFFAAIENNDYKAVEKAVETIKDIEIYDARDPLSQYLLPDVVTLVKEYADIKKVLWNNAFHIAIAAQDILAKNQQQLTSKERKHTVENEFTAAEGTNKKIIELLTKTKHQLLIQPNSKGITPIDMLVATGRMHMLKILVTPEDCKRARYKTAIYNCLPKNIIVDQSKVTDLNAIVDIIEEYAQTPIESSLSSSSLSISSLKK